MATRTLEIDLRQGTGASSEPMYGVVTVQRAKAKSAGGFEILPFEATLKLINGKATITEAETDGTGPLYDSAYLFRVQNGYCGRRYGFMAALPDGTTPITTGELPMVDPITGEGIYMDAQEWNALYGDLPNKVSGLEVRVGTLEDVAGLTPESPIDAQTADLIQQPDTLTNAAVSTVVGEQLTEVLLTKVDVEDVLVQAGNSSFTNGSIVRVGAYSFIVPETVNMGVVQGGGVNNENVIGGNFDNVNTATSNLVGVPTLTGTDGMWNFILSGYDNVVNGWACVVNGFHNRVAQGGNHATISGGSIHTIRNCNYPTIGGGTGHEIADGASGATIGGGIGHKASNTSTTIAGGNTNEASGMSSTVGGGRMHKASGSNSTISGGDTNTASGSGSAVPGGISNTAAGLGSVATGRGGNAFANGMRAHGSMVSTPGDAQDMIVNLKRDTTDGVASGLSLDGTGGLVIPVDTTWAIEGTVVARRTDADGEYASWTVKAMLTRNAGNTALLIGTPTVTPLGANSGNAWSVAVGYATAGNLSVTVTGEAAKTIRWLANLRIVSVSG